MNDLNAGIETKFNAYIWFSSMYFDTTPEADNDDGAVTIPTVSLDGEFTIEELKAVLTRSLIMEELKITFVDVEMTALKLTKDHTLVVHVPKYVFSDIVLSKLTHHLTKALPGVNTLILPMDFEISVVEKV